MPALSRDLVVVIQGLVILFAGALEHMFRPRLEALFARPAPARGLMSARRLMDALFLQALLLADSTIRLATPLVLAALAGLFAERSGVVDIGLEGKMLGAAFAAAATAAVTGSAWLGLGAGIVVRDLSRHGARLCLHHPPRQPGGLGHGAQHHGRGPRPRRWPRPGSGRAAARRCSARTRASSRSSCRSPRQLRGVPVLGPIYAELISGHNILVYVDGGGRCRWSPGWSIAPASACACARSARTRARSTPPASASTLMRYKALLVTGLLCGIAGTYLSIAHNASFIRDMTAGKGYLALAALIFGKWRPVPALLACLLFAFTDAVQIRLQGMPLPLIGEVPTQAIQALPYLVTVLLLAGFVGRAVAPKAIGEPYVKER